MTTGWKEPPTIAQLNQLHTRLLTRQLIRSMEASLADSVREYTDTELYRSHYSRLAGCIMLFVEKESLSAKELSRLKGLCTALHKPAQHIPELQTYYARNRTGLHMIHVSSTCRLSVYVNKLPSPFPGIIDLLNIYAAVSFVKELCEIYAPELLFVDIADTICEAGKV